MTAVRTGPTKSRRELVTRVRALRAEGKVHREVAMILGISRSYASQLATDADGEKTRARKDSYRGICEVCGGPTDGSNGTRNAPSLCWECSHARRSAERKWPRETVIDAIQRFAAINGRPPKADEWVRGDPEMGYPPRSSVYRASHNSSSPFERWGDAIEAAGFPRPLTGHYERPPKFGHRNVKIEGRSVSMRDFVVLEQQEDGSWITHEGLNAYSEALAIEKYAEGVGAVNGRISHRFVAVPAHRWIVRELQPVTTFKAVMAEAVQA